ncbi:MAG TPA: response regulator [Caulobacteraceae bacterium]|nr:response regulator [Caulobacteraceae bacterium]
MPVSPNSIINLSAASVLLVEPTNQGMDILSQICFGFGVRSPHRCFSAADAQEFLAKIPVDLIICEAELQDKGGYELIRWLRRSELDPNAKTSTVLISGHTPLRNVIHGRDCGANAVVVKPLTPKILLDRIIWLAADKRDFVQSETYAGPDRRWRNLGPPPGTAGRRRNDLSASVGQAIDPNLEQSDIDAMFRPTKVAI